jgi:hypothetical protein
VGIGCDYEDYDAYEPRVLALPHHGWISLKGYISTREPVVLSEEGENSRAMFAGISCSSTRSCPKSFLPDPDVRQIAVTEGWATTHPELRVPCSRSMSALACVRQLRIAVRSLPISRYPGTNPRGSGSGSPASPGSRLKAIFDMGSVSHPEEDLAPIDGLG